MADAKKQLKGKENKKNSQSLKRVQAKAHYNFHKRLRDAEEERRFKDQLDSGEFNVDESPLLDKSDVDAAVAADQKKGNQA